MVRSALLFVFCAVLGLSLGLVALLFSENLSRSTRLQRLQMLTDILALKLSDVVVADEERHSINNKAEALLPQLLSQDFPEIGANTLDVSGNTNGATLNLYIAQTVECGLLGQLILSELPCTVSAETEVPTSAQQ